MLIPTESCRDKGGEEKKKSKGKTEERWQLGECKRNPPQNTLNPFCFFSSSHFLPLIQVSIAGREAGHTLASLTQG